MGLATVFMSTNANAQDRVRERVNPDQVIRRGRPMDTNLIAPQPHAAPELDPAGAAAMGLIVMGAGVIVLERRRRMA